MQKEYFITIRLKNDETRTYWFFGTCEEAEKATCNLVTRFNAVWGTNRSPQDYTCMACFMFDMERQGYTGHYELYPLNA